MVLSCGISRHTKSDKKGIIMAELEKSPISYKRESWGKALKVTGVIEVCSLLLYLCGVFTPIIQWSYLIFMMANAAFMISLIAFIAADLLDAYRQSPKA